MRFVYSVVRFVPDPARGEFVNVGAIVGSEESSEWDVQQISNPVRARAIDDHKALDGVWSFLDRVGRDIDEHEQATERLLESPVELSEAWLEGLFINHRNIVQLSPPTPMVASSSEEALDRVFEQMIVDPAQRKYRFRKKHVALAAVRAAYRRHGIRERINLRERVAVQTESHSERFDFAVTNGHVLQLAQTWSFQVPDQESLAEQVKAWGWTVRDLQQHGGQAILTDGSRFGVTSEVDVEVVFVPPAEGQDASAMKDAYSVFKQLGVRHAPVEDADQIGQRASELLVRAGTGHLGL
jgi:Protein of unknown function (DUF3037)